MRKRRSRRRAIGTRAPILVEVRVNARWLMDFVHDQFAGGRRLRILNVVDDVTRECLAAIRFCRSLRARRKRSSVGRCMVYVKNHVAELEVRGAQEVGGSLGGARTLVIETEYGLNDRVSLALVGAIGREPGEVSKLHSLGLEGVVYLGRIPAVGVDAGLYLEYGHGFNSESDFGEAKLLLAKRSGRFEGLFNFIIERPLGVRSPLGRS